MKQLKVYVSYRSNQEEEICDVFHLFRAKSLSNVEYNTRLKTHNTGDITGPILLLLRLDAPKVFLCLFFIKFNIKYVNILHQKIHILEFYELKSLFVHTFDKVQYSSYKHK